MEKQLQTNTLLTISKFSKLANISRANLIFYDQKDIFKPAYRDEENNYRYYTYHQLNQAHTLDILRKFGIPLKEIKNYFNQHDLLVSKKLIAQQLQTIEEKIIQLEKMVFHLKTYQDNLADLQEITYPSFHIKKKNSFSLYLSPQKEEIEKTFASMYDFLAYCKKENIDYYGHLGRLFSPQKLKSGNIEQPDHIFIQNPNGNYQTKEATYLIYYQKTDGRDLKEIYQTIYDYIVEHHLTITGNTYEDYPLTGIVPFSNDRQVIRIMTEIKNDIL